MTAPTGRNAPPPPEERPDDREDPPSGSGGGPPGSGAPGNRAQDPGPSGKEEERHSLNRDGQQGVHDRNASKGRRYVRDDNPSAEGNDPSLTSGPTRERKI